MTPAHRSTPPSRPFYVVQAAPTTTTRDMLAAAWRATSRCAGPLVLNHASAAGWILSVYPNVLDALMHCPVDPWYEQVVVYLEQVVDEERARETMPRLPSCDDEENQ